MNDRSRVECEDPVAQVVDREVSQRLPQARLLHSDTKKSHRSLSMKPYCKVFRALAGLAVILTMIFLFSAGVSRIRQGYIAFGLVTMCFVFVFWLYAAFLTYRPLDKIKILHPVDEEDFLDMIRKLHQAKPAFRYSIQRESSEEVFRQDLEYADWYDTSPDQELRLPSTILKKQSILQTCKANASQQKCFVLIKLILQHDFIDEATAMDFEMQKAQFAEENHLTVGVNDKMKMFLNDCSEVPKELLISHSPHRSPFCVSLPVFRFFNLFGLALIAEALVDICCTSKQSWVIRKTVSSKSLDAGLYRGVSARIVHRDGYNQNGL